MSRAPDIDAVILQPCCEEALKRIRGNQKIGSALKLAGPGMDLIGAMMGKTPYGTAFKVSTAHWGAITNAIQTTVPSAVRDACLRIAEEQEFTHSMQSNRNLKLFWQGMKASFGGA